MADERNTSYSKDLQIESYLQSTAERIESSKEEFNASAENSLEVTVELEGQQEDGGEKDSGQVSGSAAENNMRPPPEIAQTVDRAQHQADLSAVHRGAAEHKPEHRELNENLESGLENELEGGPEAGGRSWPEWQNYQNNILNEVDPDYENGQEKNNSIEYNNEEVDYDLH